MYPSRGTALLKETAMGDHRWRPPHVVDAIERGEYAALRAMGVRGNRSPKRLRAVKPKRERDSAPPLVPQARFDQVPRTSQPPHELTQRDLRVMRLGAANRVRAERASFLALYGLPLEFIPMDVVEIDD